MRIIYGTTNNAKLEAMRRFLKDIDVEILGLRDIDCELPTVCECGRSPLENAEIKAKAYYNALKAPVFSCDSGLYFENLPASLSPGVNVRRVNGIELTDEEMTEHYSRLAQEYGDIRARYHNAICLVLDNNNVYTDDSDDLCGEEFIITSQLHSKRVQGFPLDCLSKRVSDGKYYYDCPDSVTGRKISGFKRFFDEALRQVPPRLT